MTAEGDVTFYVPGLCAVEGWPLAPPVGIGRFLAAARRAPWVGADGYAARALTIFGLPEDAGLAALARLGEGLPRDGRWWVRCDPVHLAVDGDRLLVLDNETLALDGALAQALAERVAGVFAAEGGALSCAAPSRWYLTLPHPEPLQTTSLADVAGRNAGDYLPRGNTRYWRSRFNEAQMVLHQALAAAGGEAERNEANSVWLWGAGYAPPPQAGPFTCVYSDDVLLCGMAAATGARAAPLPAGPTGLCERSALVVLRGAQGPVQYGDTEAWSEFLEALMDVWLRPLARELWRGARGQLRVLGERGPVFTLRRRDLWRIWRAARS